MMILLLFLILIYKSYGQSYLFEKNTCPTYSDYLLKNNPKCYHNPDVTPNIRIILKNHFKAYSKHRVITEDGYILNLYRIPQNNPKGVIIMQNSLILDGIQFVGQGNTSFAYFFHSQGYEIWLSSTRGTTLSPGHVTLTQTDPEFWNWSFEESGKYDTRTVINHVKKTVQPGLNLIFLGYSQSGGDALIYSSLYPKEAQQNLKLLLLVAPAAYYGSKSNFLLFPDITTMLLNLLTQFGKHSLLQMNSIEARLCRAIMEIMPDKKLAHYIMDVGAGLAPSQDDPTLFYAMLTHIFRGTSTKNMKYYNQQAKSNRFQMYDYGKTKNMKLYGKTVPPEYPIENIKTPIFIFSGENDAIVTTQGIKWLHSKLPYETKIYGGPTFIKDYNHFHFSTGKARVQVYHKILKILNKL